MCEFEGGVKAHVLEDNDRSESALEFGVPGLSFEGQLKSGSLIVFIESGDRLTLPGVIVGSSSMFLRLEFPFQGFPGSNSGTKSFKALYASGIEGWIAADKEFGISFNSLCFWIFEAEIEFTVTSEGQPLESSAPGKPVQLFISFRVRIELFCLGSGPGARLNSFGIILFTLILLSSLVKEGFQVVWKRDNDWELISLSLDITRELSGGELLKKSLLEVCCECIGAEGLALRPTLTALGVCGPICWLWCCSFRNIACCAAIWFWRLRIRCFVWVICTLIDDWRAGTAAAFVAPVLLKCWFAEICNWCKTFICCNNWYNNWSVGGAKGWFKICNNTHKLLRNTSPINTIAHTCALRCPACTASWICCTRTRSWAALGRELDCALPPIRFPGFDPKALWTWLA